MTDADGNVVDTLTEFNLIKEPDNNIYRTSTIVDSDGTYRANLVTATDAAGNAFVGEATDNTTVDTTPPAITDLDLTTNSGSLDVSVSADEPLDASSVVAEVTDESGTTVATLNSFNESDATNEYADSYDLPDGANETWTVNVTRAEDDHGLDGASGQNASVFVDTVAPAVSNFTATFDNGTVTVTFDADESLSTDAGDTVVEFSDPDGDPVTEKTVTALGGRSYEVTYNVEAGVEGNYTANLTSVRDTAGNVGASGAADTAFVDTGPPAVSNFTATNPTDQTIRVSFGADESLTDISVGVSGPENATLTETDFTAAGGTYTVTYAVSDDGEYEVTLETAADTHDNDGADGQRKNVTVDSTAPTVTDYEVTNADGDGAVSDGERVSVVLTASDEFSTVENVTANVSELGAGTVELAGSGADGVYRGNFTVDASNVPDGNAALSVNLTDVRGNAHEVFVRYLLLDAHNPNTTHTFGGTPNENGWYNSSVEINLTASDGMSGTATTEYRLTSDGTTDDNWTTYDGNVTVSADGSHTITYRSVDHTGNAEENRTAEFDVDTTTPMTTSGTNATPNENGWYTSDVNVTLTPIDVSSGVNATYYRVDGDWKQYDASTGVHLTTDGNHTVEFYSVDEAGNEEAHRTRTVKIDTKKPTLSDPPGLNRTEGILPEQAVRVVVNATDGNGVADVIVDGKRVGKNGEGFVPVAPALGDHTFEVVVRDVAGNELTVSNESTAYSVGRTVEMRQTANDTFSAETNDTNVGAVSIRADATNETTASVAVGTAKSNPEPNRTDPKGTSLYFPQIDTSVSNDDITNATVTVTVDRSRVRQKYVRPDSVAFWVEEENRATGWETVDARRTDANESDGTYTYEVEAPHFSTYAVTGETESAAPNASLGVATDSPTPGNVTLTASYGDGYSGVDPANVTFRFEGTDRTAEATVGESALTYTRNLSAGTYNATLFVTDNAGNPLAEPETVSFSVEKSAGGGSGGGGGGGGGGNVPDPSVQVRVTDLTASSLRAKVVSARSDSPGDVSPDGGISAGDVTVRELRVTPASGDPEPRFFVDASVTETPPGGADAPDVPALGYLRVGTTFISTSALAEVGVEFAVPADVAAAPENVVVYRLDGDSWRAVETEVVETGGGRYVLRAAASDTGTFAVGVRSGAVSVTDASVGASSVAPGETVPVTATVENTGDGVSATTARVSVDGDVVAREPVELSAGESKTVTVDVTLDSPGTHEIAVNGASAGSVSVGGETTSSDGNDPDETTGGPTDDGSSGDIPGFGVSTALVALVAALLVARYRR
ncbi:OmpL47-type beta-barrel domain-containing protein [Halorussus sp. MSC15.2]|uniref:OmpL47-type beta-barrel domain-containing protein n=1 Tax=Halorussus sp. MSC15.2 TaxID=2283638 RepID=UPI0013D7C22E|nr:PGF-pre-PGF domain-containing protein [Halorussus sp. MSC15.2]NEU55289.1 PGF-pre-PGF domain-containing protein [Halorussus sp. MSC15.2]